jgi:hypothetical protein
MKTHDLLLGTGGQERNKKGRSGRVGMEKTKTKKRRTLLSLLSFSFCHYPIAFLFSSIVVFIGINHITREK